MEELNKNKTKLDIGEQINDAFEIYKKIALMGGLAMTTIYIIVIMLTFIALGFFFNMKQMPELLKDFKPENLSLINQAKYLLGVVAFVSLVSPFMAGILKMAKNADDNEEVEFSAVFFYINSPQFIHIVLATATLTIVSNVLSMFIKYSIPQSGESLGLLVTLTISALTYLAIPIIIFKKVSFISAISTSIQQISSNFPIAVLLMIIAFVLSMLGVIAFCFGILFTVPFMSAMNYAMYKKLNN